MTNVIRMNGAVAEYNGEDMMCTYPCGHVYVLLLAPKGDGDEHGLFPGRATCPTCG